jgi:hypothetical protein
MSELMAMDSIRIFMSKVPQILSGNTGNMCLVLVWITICSSKMSHHAGLDPTLSRVAPMIGERAVIRIPSIGPCVS